MNKKTQRYILLLELLLIAGLLFFFRGQIMAWLNPASSVLVNNPAPDLGPGTWINSEPLKISDLRGRVVLLDFWTYKCGPCTRMIPQIEEWHRKYPELVIIGVHSPESAEEAVISNLRHEVNALGITYPVVTDNGYISWGAYKTQLWPTLYLIDKRGEIHDFHRGSLGLSGVEATLQTLMKQ